MNTIEELTEIIKSEINKFRFYRPPTAEENGRHLVASIDAFVHDFGGSATFDRVEGDMVYYNLTLPPTPGNIAVIKELQVPE